jgi:hypothetical protein
MFETHSTWSSRTPPPPPPHPRFPPPGMIIMQQPRRHPPLLPSPPSPSPTRLTSARSTRRVKPLTLSLTHRRCSTSPMSLSSLLVVPTIPPINLHLALSPPPLTLSHRSNALTKATPSSPHLNPSLTRTIAPLIITSLPLLSNPKSLTSLYPTLPLTLPLPPPLLSRSRREE